MVLDFGGVIAMHGVGACARPFLVVIFIAIGEMGIFYLVEGGTNTFKKAGVVLVEEEDMVGDAADVVEDVLDFESVADDYLLLNRNGEADELGEPLGDEDADSLRRVVEVYFFDQPLYTVEQLLGDGFLCLCV